MLRVRVVLVTACALITLPGLAYGQAVGEIVGIVQDQEGQVNQQAQVRAVGPELSAVADTLSAVVDSTGRYRIPIRRPGRWRIKPIHIGYGRVEPVSVDVGAGERVEIDLLLGPALPALREARPSL
jgi:Carboxypeptidase regulatory-like domain